MNFAGPGKIKFIISAKCERCEHRRLVVLSVIPSFLLCTWWLIMAMTSLHQQPKQQRPLLLFPPSMKRLFLPLPFPCCIM